ncbi:adenosylcobinamide-phosphate synthase CbiB [Methylobacillus gramineus]|uniref:adenosylcobinamide-phosphate synthase CbiB n=1 Tax=Methylobacillus gramineus TaxID=755169 RepID=UPI001CFFFB96|nr:adenosylcobinamide-phosphate synthase CbiB [Methylobacillus gramineus]MCB5185472.1 adenosylcobinamide-phosphate synthase CbiB [Methylobacillus gramineus]
MSLTHYPTTYLVTPALLIAALWLDRLLGEPRQWHPLAGFGNLAHWLEKRMNRDQPPWLARLSGVLGWLLLLLPLIAIAYWITHLPYGWIADILLLYFAVGARSLNEHAMRIYHALHAGDLSQARHAVSMIVSRDTQDLNQTEIATATVESVLENGNDAIFGAIFWFVLLGGTGALMFRLANTLDAMWGYRTPRFLYFGWAAARLDDMLNLIPARLTALSYALCGHTRTALHCWKTQAPTWYSPNAGPVMAAGAGALQVTLGGVAPYHGQIKSRPTLGIGPDANTQHIQAAVALVQRSIWLWVGVLALAFVMTGFMHA